MATLRRAVALGRQVLWLRQVHGRLGHRARSGGAGPDLAAVTHRFPLECWHEAVLALKDPRRTGAVKILLEPGR